MVHKVLKAFKVKLVLKVRRVHRVLKVFKVRLVRRVRKAWMVLKDRRDQLA
jgi:hypothetical protein